MKPVLVGAAYVVLGALLSCATPDTQLARPDEGVRLETYPAGRWRLARREDLEHVVLWVSHILIRHEAVRPGVASFHLPDWTPQLSRPTRTRDQALEQAQRIAQRLRNHPELFAQLARELSEDPATSSRGGSLGGISALSLYDRYPQVLDALSTLKAGEVSRVVESAHGFHIFLRRDPPREETVSGARIVIGYDEAPWLRAFLARWDIPIRTRAQALALAESVHAQARAGESFESLVHRYSDHEEALRGGDFGEWSTRQASTYPREVEILQELKVGEVAPPLDSPFGVEIISRTQNRPRQRYAMSVIEQIFAGPLKGNELPTQATVLHEMTRLAAEVKRDPSRFSSLQKELCCSGVQQWPEGQGSAFAEQALAPLNAGEIAPSVIPLNGAYAIIRREPSTPQTAATVAFELPSPAKADLAYLAGSGFLVAHISSAAAAASEALRLEGPRARELADLHERARQSIEDDGSLEERVERFTDFQKSVQQLLGARYGEYVAFLEEYFTGLLLRQ